jgi:hypothetical protein
VSPPRTDPDSTGDDAHELLVPRASAPDSPGAAALGHLLEQSNREAAANRAQARELVKALENVQRSHEYLGKALLDERRKSRWLALAFVLGPIAAAACVWLVWSRVDAMRADYDARLAKIAAEEQSAREAEAAKTSDGRIAELTGDLAALRRDLDGSREALESERRHVTDREAALAAAEGRGESARTEIGALEFEVKSSKAKANAEQGRANALETKIRELEASLTRTKPADAPAAASPAPSKAEPAPDAAKTAGPVAVVAPAPAAAPPAEKPKPAPAKPSPTEQADLDKAMSVINHLLAESGDTVLYRFESLGGIAGRTLVGVKVVGTDGSGSIVRTIIAERAEITTQPDTSSVVLRFTDGKLVVGAMEAPFFDGNYGLVVHGDAAQWKAAAAWMKAD